ncbi:serine/threonine protein kinase [Rubinisphaera margarita]|uniref:serine/threonine protein kinase n=1 Tax=Rubinisphaera margarita TaxID=2909586 RepID=UPI001EE7A159|nr:serine/threonine protein kinase [Rubinisphaera margarita]MCG6158482.1 serine/threonine protein kinase [Rubinisphaera margarita]
MSRIASTSRTHVSRLKSVAGSALTASLRVRKHLWLGPALTTIVVAAVGWWTMRSVETSVKANLASQLQSLLNADVAGLELWLTDQRSETMALGEDDRVRQPAIELAAIAEQADASRRTADLLTSEALGQLREHITPWMEAHRVSGFVLINPDSLILASDLDIGIGDASIASLFEDKLVPVFAGETILIPPFKSKLIHPDIDGTARVGVPVMYLVAPVRNDDGEPIAALGLRIRPEEEFTSILSVAHAGQSGETYAFNREGVMITNSRFDEQLKENGMLPDEEHVRSLLNIQIRDPGVNLMTGKRPAKRRSEQPLTQMVARAIEGDAGVDVNGYRDYRGVPVVGAWTWLPDYQIGMATEFDAAEAFGPLNSIRTAFGVLTGLLIVTTLGLCGLTYYASHLDLKVRQAAIESRQLGQYSLDEKLGEGGMGVVYRAHHQMLHRPTALKLLHAERTDEQALVRFEREVQLTSQLTHPNTIAIYDYGHTAEGVFYYVMEYLNGFSLDSLIQKHGPQAEGRVIYILRQLCDSLSEAHQLGMIHRDVKPANIMLTQYGGLHDFVKLLDFGLVKPRDADQNTTLAGSLTGTPLYLSPEAIRHEPLDARSDLYAVGAVGYFLLTGTTVFEGRSIVDVCNDHVKTTPEKPSARLGRTIDEDLERLILSCLEKQKADRPESAAVLEQELASCQSAGSWTRSSAKTWWQTNIGDGQSPAEASPSRTSPEATIIASPTDEGFLRSTS